MRILTVGNRYPPWSVGGYERLWAGLVADLRERGHHVRVLTTRSDPGDLAGSGTPAIDPDVHRELGWYWREHAFPRCSLAATVRRERANAAVFGRHLAAHRPDVVVWFSMGGMSLALLGQAAAAGLPAVAVVADDWLSYAPRVDGLSRRLPGPLRRRLSPVVTRALGIGPGPRMVPGPQLRVSFISRFLRDAARASGGWTAAGDVDHPGVDPGRFAPAAPAPWAGRLLCCGRIDPRKGIAIAIQALAQLPDASLTVDGDGDRSERERLIAVAVRAGVGDRVRWQVSAPEALAGVYAACDALVFGVTWPEPWGLVPLEAMAVGRPVIATRTDGGTAEYLHPEVNCIVVTPGDPAGLAGAVRRLATEPELRERLVAGGRRTAARLTQAGWQAAIRGHLQAVTA
ncbi:MAG: glycosyltransferase family 4 protein [Solirubrobacteraceae bacterium]